jgi:hypothetical protein
MAASITLIQGRMLYVPVSEGWARIQLALALRATKYIPLRGKVLLFSNLICRT